MPEDKCRKDLPSDGFDNSGVLRLLCRAKPQTHSFFRRPAVSVSFKMRLNSKFETVGTGIKLESFKVCSGIQSLVSLSSSRLFS